MWSELSTEHDVRYTGKGRSFTIPMSKISGVAEEFMSWWLGSPVQRSDRSSRQHNHVGVSPSRVQPRVPIHVVGVEVARHQQSPAIAVRSAPISGRAGRQEVSREDFRRFVGQYDLNGHATSETSNR